MNDAYGDPRNYDPNDPYFDPYDYDATWGAPMPPAPQSQPASPYPWTDPDNARPNWLNDPNADLSANNPGPGNRWAFVNGQWTIIPMLREAPKPAPTGGGDVGGDYGDDGGGGFYNYQPPQRMPLAALNYPNFNAPRFNAPAPFSYEEFKAPTLEEAQAEPGFDYALKQGIKAYENSKAYLGTYRSGGTIKGLNDYARNMATQNYGQVYSRKADTYDRNRNNAAGAYATNYGISRDVFDRNYTAAKDEYAPKAKAAELEFGRDWDMYAYEGDDAFRRWQTLVNANTP